MLVGLNVANAQMAHVVEGGPQSDGIGHVGCSGFETCWRHIILRALYRHVLDHIATTLPGLHLVEYVLAAIHHADAVGAIDLMAGEDEEVGAELLHIDRRVGYRLRSVNQHRDVVRVGDVDDALHIVDGAEGIVHMTYTHETGAGCYLALEL